MLRGILIGFVIALTLFGLMSVIPPFGVLADHFDRQEWAAAGDTRNFCARNRMWSDLARRKLKRGQSPEDIQLLLGGANATRPAKLLFYRAHGASACFVYDLGLCGPLVSFPREAELCFSRGGDLVTWRRIRLSDR